MRLIPQLEDIQVDFISGQQLFVRESLPSVNFIFRRPCFSQLMTIIKIIALRNSSKASTVGWIDFEGKVHVASELLWNLPYHTSIRAVYFISISGDKEVNSVHFFFCFFVIAVKYAKAI